MGFIDSYKRLEKLCNEIYGDNHGLSSYIDEMINDPIGSYYVSGWNENLKQLKHYRWMRIQIVHEPDCTEGNMCELEDVLWLDNFHSHIMNQTDPLALYHKATRPRTVARPAQRYQPSQPSYTYPAQTPKQKQSSSKAARWLVFLIVAALVGSFFVLKFYMN